MESEQKHDILIPMKDALDVNIDLKVGSVIDLKITVTNISDSRIFIAAKRIKIEKKDSNGSFIEKLKTGEFNSNENRFKCTLFPEEMRTFIIKNIDPLAIRIDSVGTWKYSIQFAFTCNYNPDYYVTSYFSKEFKFIKDPIDKKIYKKIEEKLKPLTLNYYKFDSEPKILKDYIIHERVTASFICYTPDGYGLIVKIVNKVTFNTLKQMEELMEYENHTFTKDGCGFGLLVSLEPHKDKIIKNLRIMDLDTYEKLES